MSDIFSLFEHLLKQSQCKSDNHSVIDLREILKPTDIDIGLNTDDQTKILISGSFIDLNGKRIKGRPVEMDIPSALSFATAIIDACEAQVSSLISELEDE